MPSGATERALARSADGIGPALLGLAEDQWFDRKSARTPAKDLADSLIGFGNAEGGIVAVGLWNGTVEGTDRGAKLRNDQMQAAIDHTFPPVRARSRLVPCRLADGTEDHLLVV